MMVSGRVPVRSAPASCPSSMMFSRSVLAQGSLPSAIEPFPPRPPPNTLSEPIRPCSAHSDCTPRPKGTATPTTISAASASAR